MWLQLDTDLLSQPRWLNCSLPARMWYLHIVAHCIDTGAGTVDRNQWQATRAMRGKLCLMPDEYPDMTAESLILELASPQTHLIDITDTEITVRGFDKRYEDTVVKKASAAERQREYRKRKKDETRALRECYDDLPPSNVTQRYVTSHNGSVTVASPEYIDTTPVGVEKDTPPPPPQGGDCSEPKTTSAQSRRRPDTIVVPEELEGLELYEVDAKLCKRWSSLYAAWQQAYPGLDIMEQVRKAHAWEVSNPSKRKKDRAKYLGNWLGRAQDDWRVKKKVIDTETDWLKDGDDDDIIRVRAGNEVTEYTREEWNDL